MNESDPVTSARETFRTRVLEWHTATTNTTTDADTANRQGDQLRSWVGMLDEQGITADVLTPFLTDDAPALRYGAASFLLRRGHEDAALPILEELADDDTYGAVASNADTALLVWRREQRARR